MSITNSNTRMKTLIPQDSSPIIYIMVVGFHHKFGCQLEFVYPTDKLIRKRSTGPELSTSSCPSPNIDLYSLPKKWAHLPSLALPDGSHNYISDYIYFHLEDENNHHSLSFIDDNDASPPSNENSNEKEEQVKINKPNRTLFGISCYRQINASEMLNKDSNVTRNTLQKRFKLETYLN